jgi:spermidine dehydrogenase
MSKDGQITRRDFVGGTMVGTGAALLGMAAPGGASTAQAQTLATPLSGLGPEWTGPGGIGEYARSNGNTHEVVNAAHDGIRNGNYDNLLRAAKDTGETFDLIIVGCGTSGMSACLNYRSERPSGSVLMVDQHAIFGGHAKQNEIEVDGYHLTAPQAATGLVVPYEKAAAAGLGGRYHDLIGLPKEYVFQKPTGMTKDVLVPEDAWTPMHIGWERSDTGFFYEGKGWVKNPWNNGFKEAPISEAGKRGLMQLENYHVPPRRADWEQWLDSMTYQQFLSDVVGLEPAAMPEVLQYLGSLTSAMGCGMGPDVISARAAYGVVQPGVLAYWRAQMDWVAPTGGMYLATFPGGHAGTNRHFLKKVMPRALTGGIGTSDIINGAVQWELLDQKGEQVRMRLGSTVLSVRHDGPPESAKSVVVTYRKDGKTYKARAKGVVLCSQQHVNRRISPDISKEYRDAMATFHHAPMHVINVAVRHWRFLENLGIASARWFGDFGWWLSLRRNLEIPGQVTQPLDPSKPTILTLYNPRPLPGLPLEQQCTAARMLMYSMSYAQIEAAVRKQFTMMFGDHGFDADRDIAGIISNRWGHAYAVDPPGFFFGKDGKPAPRDILRRRFYRISFGHSELSGTQGWETAAGEGERAALSLIEVV